MCFFFLLNLMFFCYKNHDENVWFSYDFDNLMEALNNIIFTLILKTN